MLYVGYFVGGCFFWLFFVGFLGAAILFIFVLCLFKYWNRALMIGWAYMFTWVVLTDRFVVLIVC